MVGDKSLSSRIFNATNIIILGIIALLCILPFIHVIGSSFATGAEIAQRSFLLFPTQFSLDAYRYIFSTDTLLRSMGVSIGVTLGGTVWSMLLSVLTAYGLSRRDLVGRRFLMFFIVFTMLFNGGMIPDISRCPANRAN